MFGAYDNVEHVGDDLLTSRGAELDDQSDREVFLDHVAGQALIAHIELPDGGHYIVLDPETGAFLFVPWDLNNSTWSQADFPLTANTAWGMRRGWQIWPWTRAFGSPSFRDALVLRLGALLQDEFGPEMDAAIDQIDQEITPALQVEPDIWR